MKNFPDLPREVSALTLRYKLISYLLDNNEFCPSVLSKEWNIPRITIHDNITALYNKYSGLMKKELRPLKGRGRPKCYYCINDRAKLVELQFIFQERSNAAKRDMRLLKSLGCIF